MISKDNIKYYILIAFISIILYKAIDSPRQILDSINGLMSFFSPFLIGILLTLLLNPMIKMLAYYNLILKIKTEVRPI